MSYSCFLIGHFNEALIPNWSKVRALTTLRQHQSCPMSRMLCHWFIPRTFHQYFGPSNRFISNIMSVLKGTSQDFFASFSINRSKEQYEPGLLTPSRTMFTTFCFSHAYQGSFTNFHSSLFNLGSRRPFGDTLDFAVDCMRRAGMAVVQWDCVWQVAKATILLMLQQS